MDSRGRKPKDRESRDVQHHFRGLTFSWGEPGVRQHIPALEIHAKAGRSCSKCGLAASWLLAKVSERREDRAPGELPKTNQRRTAAQMRKLLRSRGLKLDSHIELISGRLVEALDWIVAPNSIVIKILDDGSILSRSGKFDAQRHDSAEGFFNAITRALGGKLTSNSIEAVKEAVHKVKVPKSIAEQAALIKHARQAYSRNASPADVMRLKHALQEYGVAPVVVSEIIDAAPPAYQGTQGDEPDPRTGAPKREEDKGTFLTRDGGGLHEVVRQNRNQKDKKAKVERIGGVRGVDNNPDDEDVSDVNQSDVKVFQHTGGGPAIGKSWTWDRVEKLLDRWYTGKVIFPDGRVVTIRLSAEEGDANREHHMRRTNRQLGGNLRRAIKALTPEQNKKRNGGDEWTSLNLVVILPGTETTPAVGVVKPEPFVARELELVERKHAERSYVFALADSDAPDGTPRYRIVKGVPARGWKRSTQKFTPWAIRLVEGKEVPLNVWPEENTVLTYQSERIFEVLFEKLTYAETMAQLGEDCLTHGDIFEPDTYAERIKGRRAKRVAATGRLIQYPPKRFCPECGDEHPQGEVFDITGNLPRAPGHTGVLRVTNEQGFTIPPKHARDSHSAPLNTPALTRQITGPTEEQQHELKRRREANERSTRMSIEQMDQALRRAQKAKLTPEENPKADPLPRDAKPQGTGGAFSAPSRLRTAIT